MLYSVRCLLELSDLSDDVGYLKKICCQSLSTFVQKMSVALTVLCAHHPHFGEVNETFLSKIWSSFLNEGQVCKIHSQVWHTWRIAAGEKMLGNDIF